MPPYSLFLTSRLSPPFKKSPYLFRNQYMRVILLLKVHYIFCSRPNLLNFGVVVGN